MSNNFWEATYRQNIGKMIGICCRYTQNRQVAEDLAHDAFVVAIDKVSSFENKGPFEAWLRRIVVNTALQYLREQKKQQKLGENVAYAAVYDDIREENPVDENLVFSEAELLEVISYLPEHHRLVFNLYVVDNFTHGQIATQLGISEGTSKSHLARARKKIRELLHHKLEENKERKRTFLWFLFYFKTWDIDHLMANRLRDFSITPQRKISPDTSVNEWAIPTYRPSGISYGIYMKTGLMAMASALFLTAGSDMHSNYNRKDISPVIRQKPDSTQNNLCDLNLNPITATISENPVIVEKTINSGPMKNLSTLGGLLLASLAVDTAGLSTELPVLFKNRQIAINPVGDFVTKLDAAQPVTIPDSALPSGTFYASKLFWSRENNELYFMGNQVKVNFRKNKFMGKGQFTFIGKVSYLVIDGTPVKLNDTIKLQEKAYRLTELDQSEGVKKYGDNGKSGVVEITLAE